MHSRSLVPRLSLAASLLALPASAGEVYVVGEFLLPGIDFTDVQSAVNAALDGDTVLIMGGTYDGFSVVSESLTVLADSGAEVICTSEIGVRNLSVDQEVVLRGIDVVLSNQEALAIQQCEGVVWIEDCSLSGAPGAGLFADPGGPDGSPGVRIDASRAVFQRCEVIGGAGSDLVPFLGLQGSGGEGARVENGAAASFYDCTISAGDGGDVDTDEFAFPGGNGGHAIHFRSGTLMVSGCVLTAGDGGLAGYDPDAPGGALCGDGGDGGAAIGHGAILTGPADAYRLDSLLVAGAAGLGGGDCGAGSAGAQVDLPNGQSSEFAEASLSFEVTSPIRDDESASLRFEAPAGTPIVLLLNVGAEWLFAESLLGTLHVDLSTIALLDLGAVPAGGELVFDAPWAVPIPAGEALSFRLQAVQQSGAGFVLGAASELTVLGTE